MGKRREEVLIASGGGPFWDALEAAFIKNGRFFVSRARSGEEARKDLFHAPSLLICDLALSGTDGIALIASREKKTCALAVSYMKDARFYAAALRAGASFCIALPFEAEKVMRRALLCMEDENNTRIKNRVYMSKRERMTFDKACVLSARILLSLSLPITMDGYRYLRFAAACCACDDTLLTTLTKRLYPLVAKEFKTTPACVERSMRYAVERVFDKADMNVLEKTFGYSTDPAKGKLSVGAFLAQIVRLMHIGTAYGV